MNKKTNIPKLIGANVPRVDLQEKATGAAIFTDDIQFGKNLLFARIKRSPYPHALIKSIDISQAEELPGVKAVVTGADFTRRIGLYLKDRHIFARERVRFVGEPVAGVAAVSEEIAEQVSSPWPELPRPGAILLLGVNGTGKTTTVAKLASRFCRGGGTVVLAAADTFRAGAIEQLKLWGSRLDVPVVAQSPRSLSV